MIVENISKRQSSKLIDIEDRTFKIEKFDPLMGNYILLQLVKFVLPFGLSDKVGIPDKLTSSVNRVSMNKKDFLEFQRDVLSVCSEVLPAGDAPVVREDGSYGIIDFTSAISSIVFSSVCFSPHLGQNWSSMFISA